VGLSTHPRRAAEARHHGSKTSVASVLARYGLSPAARRLGPTWAQFLSAQPKGIFATDFFGVDSVMLGATTSCSLSN